MKTPTRGLSFRRSYSILLITAFILYSILDFGGKYIWSDEAYSLAMAGRSFSDIWRITGQDVHPPLYYFLLKIFTAPFHTSFRAGRFLSGAAMLYTVGFGGYQMKKLFSEKHGLLYMVLLFGFPFIFPYAFEVRSYAVATAFLTTCAFYAYRTAMEGRKTNWIILTISAVLVGYTHYFALLSAGFIYLILLVSILRRNDKESRGHMLHSWLLSVLACIVLYIPWMRSLLGQLAFKVNNEYWIAEITAKGGVKELLDVLSARGMKIYPLFSACVFLAAGVILCRSKDRRIFWTGLCAAAVPFLTIVTGYAVSILIRPVFIMKYAIPACSLLVVPLTLGICAAKKSTVAASMATVLFMGGISTVLVCTQEEYETRGEDEICETFTAEHSDCDSYMILTTDYNIVGLLAHYETTKPIYNDTLADRPDFPYQNIRSLASFDPSENAICIVLTDVEKPLPAELKKDYDAEYLGIKHNGSDESDAYRLTRRN